MKAAFWRNLWWHLRYPGLPADAAPQAPERRVVTADEAAGLGLAVHRYLSTGCLHGEHGYCQSNTGSNGTKTPASCKFCGAGCECPCHDDADKEPQTPQLRCVCGDAVTWMDCEGGGWIHEPGSDTKCLNARPRCPDCQLPHDLEPGSPLRNLCRSLRAAIAAEGATPPDTAEEYYAITRPLTRVLGGDRSARVIAHTLGTHGYSLAAVETMSDEELLAVPGIGETSLARIREHVPGASSDCEWDGFTRCPHCRDCVLDLDIDQHLTSCREAPVSVAGELLHCTCCCPESTHTGPGGHCVMPGCHDEPCTPMSEWRAQQAAEYEEEPVPVPRDALRGLVEVARWVSGDPHEAVVRASCTGTDDCCPRETCRLDDYHAAHPSPRPYAKAGRALAALDDAGLLDQLGEDQ